MMGKSSGFIETLPRQMRARIEFLRELQDKHDDLADEYSKELKALREKYEALYGAPSCHTPMWQTLLRPAMLHFSAARTASKHCQGKGRRTSADYFGGSNQATPPLT